MRTHISSEAASGDDVATADKSGGDRQLEIAATLEAVIDRAQKLVAQYESGRVLVRDAQRSAEARTPRRGARRRSR
jgi:hypothetical protein